MFCCEEDLKKLRQHLYQILKVIEATISTDGKQRRFSLPENQTWMIDDWMNHRRNTKVNLMELTSKEFVEAKTELITFNSSLCERQVHIEY